ncbi:MAG: peroxide stress protein YaaA [Actinomycetaceae bacterium]|nr:peroxide stress protein YaaA [Actinomycetaceae bacterium]
MLIMLPPSEGKTAPAEGSPLDLSMVDPFADDLRDLRTSVLDELVAVSARADALDILGVGQRIQPQVEANTLLWNSPTAPAYEVYSGVLYEAGKLNELGAVYSPRESFRVLVQSALFGLVDLKSRIPSYRLSMDTRLPQLGPLASLWKNRLDTLMPELSHHQIIVDCRSGAYIKAWPGLRGEHDLIRVSAVRDRGGKRSVVSHSAKRYRGMLAGALMKHAQALSESLDGVLEIAHSLAEEEDFLGVEMRDKRNYLELVLVTK